jgi:hypothetical protein
MDPFTLELLKQDPLQREQLLRSKLEANAQRNGRKSYLGALPPDLSNYLQTCEFITSTKLDDLLPNFWRYETERDWYIARQYTEVSWPHQIFELVTSFNTDYDSLPAYFYPGYNFPIFHTTFGWVRQHTNILFQIEHGGYYGNDRLGVVTTDLSAGIVIDCYCGYILSDPNPDEIVYTVTTWKSRQLDHPIERYSFQLGSESLKKRIIKG